MDILHLWTEISFRKNMGGAGPSFRVQIKGLSVLLVE